MVIKLNADTIFQMRLFRDITYVSCTDCFQVNNTLIFVTKKGDVGKAIGPQGRNIKTLRDKTNKNIKILEQSADCCSLIKNYLFPIKPKNCELVDQDGRQTAQIEFNSSRERRYLLDNQQRGLKELKEIVARYYSAVKDIRIL
ncbi:NusA-like transcription termination signal-binding factor [Candidatus Woesearchaeota archaeon]|nr:NusA-like transcription termination signal-binding factor [Candidatus Woesearchaeota archaeon]MBT4114095.1 NusA-like transcription termination signal-binding factor [Candidatus Woesearchaeota archaeon]MBT4248322.1 NusA-like transcription termination signal-binding factor [Candidatus Woesearchaeota archaeon]